MKRQQLFLLTGIGCLLAALSGYGIGRRTSFQPDTGFAAEERSGRAPKERATGDPLRTPAELAALTTRLKRSYSACPSAAHDWILRGQTAAVLATLPGEELERLLREIVEDIAVRGRTSQGAWQYALAEDVLRTWGERDPIAACTAVVSPPLTTAGRLAAFHSWRLRDPKAVAAWLEAGTGVPEDLLKVYLSEKRKSDAAGAFEGLAGLSATDREGLLLDWSTSSALVAGDREALLAAIGGDKVLLKKCAARMAAALADRSVEEGMMFVDGLGLDPAESGLLYDAVYSRWAAREPEAAFTAWAEQAESAPSKTLLYALHSWSVNSPGAEEAIAWVGTLGDGPVKEQILIGMIEGYSGGERFEQAVRLGLSLADKEEGRRQVLRVATLWKERYPAHAKEGLKAILAAEEGTGD